MGRSGPGWQPRRPPRPGVSYAPTPTRPSLTKECRHGDHGSRDRRPRRGVPPSRRPPPPGPDVRAPGRRPLPDDRRAARRGLEPRRPDERHHHERAAGPERRGRGRARLPPAPRGLVSGVAAGHQLRRPLAQEPRGGVPWARGPGRAHGGLERLAPGDAAGHEAARSEVRRPGPARRHTTRGRQRQVRGALLAGHRSARALPLRQGAEGGRRSVSGRGGSGAPGSRRVLAHGGGHGRGQSHARAGARRGRRDAPGGLHPGLARHGAPASRPGPLRGRGTGRSAARWISS